MAYLLEKPHTIAQYPTVMVDLFLSHLTALNDCRPSKHTDTNEAYPAFQHINDTNNTKPYTRLTGTNEVPISNNSTSYTNTMPYNPSHVSQCVTLSTLNPKSSSKPEMSPPVLEPITCSPVTTANLQISSTSSPSSPSALSPGSPDSDAESHNSSCAQGCL